MRTCLIIASVFILSGCSLTLDVRGQVQNSDETFTGTTTGGMDGSGTLVVRSARTTCRGDYVFTSQREGKGTFRCDDGRTGPFEFVSTGTRGTGSGDLGGQKFTFTFG